MGISVIPAMPRPNGSGASSAGSIAASADASGIDFSTLFAAQLDPTALAGDGLQLEQLASQGLVSTEEKAEPRLSAEDEDLLDPAEAGAAIAILDLLPPRPLRHEARPEGTDKTAASVTDRTPLQGLIERSTGRTAETSKQGLIERVTGRLAETVQQSTPQPLAANATSFDPVKPIAADPAKLAGETAPVAPSSILLQTATPAAEKSAAQPTQPTSIQTPLHDTRWAQDFGDRITWVAKNEIQSAQININPAHLGPVQINLSLNGDQMSASFVSAHAEVRQAIEDAMPRLRDMLAGSGINLGQANVGAQTQQQQRDTSPQFAQAPHLTREDAILPAETAVATASSGSILQRGRGMVDLFA